METAASFEVRNAPSSYPTVADDARSREVRLCHSSCEADEQSGPNRSGAGGAKGGGMAAEPRVRQKEIEMARGI